MERLPAVRLGRLGARRRWARVRPLLVGLAALVGLTSLIGVGGVSMAATTALVPPLGGAGRPRPLTARAPRERRGMSSEPASAPSTASAQASSGIRGRLDIRRVARPAERRPEVAESGAGGPRELPDLRRGVVYLESAPRAAFDEREPGRETMDQYKERFVPHVLAVMVGTVVDFPNSDRTYHNVFSLSRAKRFDLGRYAAGRSKAVRMDRPGVVRVFCDIHSHMSAFILVFNHPFFDVTEVDGRYELPNVPPGSYTVVGWYEGEQRVTRPVVVPASGWAELDLQVP